MCAATLPEAFREVGDALASTTAGAPAVALRSCPVYCVPEVPSRHRRTRVAANPDHARLRAWFRRDASPQRLLKRCEHRQRLLANTVGRFPSTALAKLTTKEVASLVSLVLYLFSENAEIRESGGDRLPAYQGPKKTKNGLPAGCLRRADKRIKT